MIAALNARDFDAIGSLEWFDNERSEFNSAISSAEGETYIGLEGLRRWARAIDEAWEGFHVHVVRIEPVDGLRAVAELRNTGTARASGIPLDMKTAQIWTFDEEDGTFLRNDSYTDPRQGFEAAGVPY
jgi:hypothetical protein